VVEDEDRNGSRAGFYATNEIMPSREAMYVVRQPESFSDEYQVDEGPCGDERSKLTDRVRHNSEHSQDQQKGRAVLGKVLGEAD
jgi:hypothetical protein